MSPFFFTESIPVAKRESDKPAKKSASSERDAKLKDKHLRMLISRWGERKGIERFKAGFEL